MLTELLLFLSLLTAQPKNYNIGSEFNARVGIGPFHTNKKIYSYVSHNETDCSSIDTIKTKLPPESNISILGISLYDGFESMIIINSEDSLADYYEKKGKNISKYLRIPKKEVEPLLFVSKIEQVTKEEELDSIISKNAIFKDSIGVFVGKYFKAKGFYDKKENKIIWSSGLIDGKPVDMLFKKKNNNGNIEFTGYDFRYNWLVNVQAKLERRVIVYR
jgi:hypothetical protein